MFSVFRAVAINPHFGKCIGFETQMIGSLFGVEKDWSWCCCIILHDFFLLMLPDGGQLQGEDAGGWVCLGSDAFYGCMFVTRPSKKGAIGIAHERHTFVSVSPYLFLERFITAC